MKKIMIAIVISTISYSYLHAQQCVTLDATGYTIDQLKNVPPIIVQLEFAQDGNSELPTYTYAPPNLTLCLSNPGFTMANVITTTTIVNQYQTNQAALAAGAAQISAWAIQLSTTAAALNTARITGFKNLSVANQAATVQGILDWLYVKCVYHPDFCQ